jgi:hypothetical protein
MQLHGSFQDLRQGDALVAMYMQQAKSLFNELATTDRPISLKGFNLYVFNGLRDEFKDLVTNLITKVEPLSYVDLHNHLLTNEFLNKTSFNLWIQTHLCCLSHLCCPRPLLIFPYLSTTPISAVTGGRYRGN